MYISSITLLTLSSLLLGCDQQAASAADEFKIDLLPDDALYGHYLPGFESSAFIPCNSDALWWATGEASQLFSIYTNIASSYY